MPLDASVGKKTKEESEKAEIEAEALKKITGPKVVIISHSDD